MNSRNRKRDIRRSTHGSRGPARKQKPLSEPGKISGHFSVVPLLLPDGEIPSAVRQALLEGRRQDAAAMLMHQYGLSCAEVSDLLGFPACE
jgi:hypothetical protein